jgi:TolB-like protein/Tfp pilus assembly protein PilF
MPERKRSRCLEFGEFVLDVAAYELRRHGRSIRLERRPMELLLLLLERYGQLVTRDEIVERLWGHDVFIDVDASVNTLVRKIRRALKDSADHSRYVQTIQGKGYRFIADVISAGTSTVLAVLPFENLQSNIDQDYVADGLTEEIIAGLGRIDPDHLSVIGRTSSMAYRGTHKTISEIGRELGIDYLLEGSIRAATGRFRITAKLSRVHDQMQVWTETIDSESTDLLGLQVELGRAIAQQIHLQLSPQHAETIRRRQTRNSDAYDLYLRGRHYYNQMTPATITRALECFSRATVIDPEYALAWAGIAHAYASRLFSSDTRPSEVLDYAYDAAERAITNGKDSPEAYTSLATVQFLFKWDWKTAETNLRHAVALDPSSVQAWWLLGHTLSHQGQHTEAMAVAQRVRELDPHSALTHSMCSQIAFSARDLEAAVDCAKEALLAEPDYWVAHYQLGQAYQQMGRAEPALHALADAARLSNGNSKPVSLAAYTHASLGRDSEALAVLAGLQERSQEHYVPPYAFALIYAALNQDARVFEWLNKALAVRDVHLIYLPIDPKWDSLRRDERFQDILRRCGLEKETRAPERFAM